MIKSHNTFVLKVVSTRTRHRPILGEILVITSPVLCFHHFILFRYRRRMEESFYGGSERNDGQNGEGKVTSNRPGGVLQLGAVHK